jgi:hypothetical protein
MPNGEGFPPRRPVRAVRPAAGYAYRHGLVPR